MSDPVKQAEDHSHGELRRDVTVWGSFMWGYADVGADIYAALGLVIAHAAGAAPLAFMLAGIVYIIIGLAYTELASAYPVAGGGQYFTMRGLGDFWGFVAGTGLLLDYTIDIALFSVASAGYFNFLVRLATGLDPVKYTISFGPIHGFQFIYCIESLVLILVLIGLNIKGMRESSLLNEILGAADIFMESGILICGFVFAWHPELLVSQWVHSFPSMSEFAYGSSLAIISFVGLESISQAAQETRRPATIVPRTSLTLIFTVFIFAVSFSSLSLGVLNWEVFKAHVGDPVATLAHALPYVGLIAGPLSATLGFTILLISANSGIMSVSRLAFSMSRYNMMDTWFNKVHEKYLTPVRTIVMFSGIGILQTLLAFLTPSAMDTLGNMYAFGATLGYILVFIAMVRLRFSDPYTPRPYRMPMNLKIKYKGEEISFPVLALIGILGVSTILFEVIWTHKIGRIAGPSWVLLCLAYYYWFRKRNKLPFFGSVKYDWETQQKAVLNSAEEFVLLEKYQQALKERDKRLAQGRQH